MSTQFDINFEVPDKPDIPSLSNGRFADGEFAVYEFAALGDRGFLKLYFYQTGTDHKNKGLYVYELESFDPAIFKEAATISKKERALTDHYIEPLQGRGLQEERLIKIDDSFAQTVADIVDVTPSQEAPAAQGDGYHNPIIGYMQKNPGLK